MAMKKTSKRRAPARRRKMVRRRVPRLSSNVPEWASCSDIREGVQLESNQIYGPSLITLAQFKRASNLAQNFQQYRITKVKYTFKPLFDTFTATTSAGAEITVPYFHYMIDKTGSIPDSATIDTLRAMGAKPRRFDDKSITVQWSPSYVISSTDSLNATSDPLVKPYISPWLNTNDTPDTANWTCSASPHFGLWYVLDAGTLPGDGQYEYNVSVEIQVQFRKPNLPTGEGSTAKNKFMTFKGDALDLSGNNA